MSRKVIFSLVVIAGLCMSSTAMAAEFAFLNYRKVVNESAEMKRVFGELETMKKAMEKQLSTMDKEIETESKALERKRSVMSEEQVLEEETALKAKIREFRIKQQNLNEQLNNEAMLRRKQITTVLQDIVAKLAQEKGYEMVLEQGNLLYADPSVDITEEVLARLNKHYDKK